MQYLKHDNFYVNQSGDLCNKQNGYSFVMFTSANCKYCSDLYPSFLRLSQSIKGCIFATMNVDADNQRIVEMSTRSKNPLEYVPFLVLYANGIPLAQYHSDESNPESNFDHMRTFLLTHSRAPDSGTNNSSVSSNAVPNAVPNAAAFSDFNIPAYSIAIPHNVGTSRSKKVCYLGYAKAYDEKKK